MNTRRGRRGNSTWGRAPLPSALCAERFKLTQFELQMQELGLFSLEDCIASRKLRDWVRSHCFSRYVPENVLAAFGLKRDVEERMREL